MTEYKTTRLKDCEVKINENFISVSFPGKVDIDNRTIVTLDGTKDIGNCNHYIVYSERKNLHRFSPEEMLCIIEAFHQKTEELKKIKQNILNLLS